MASDLRLAVADLGSNSFRLVVFAARADGTWRRTDEVHEPVRIGEGLAATGRLGDAPMRRALSTMDVFAHFARADGLADDEVDAVATSAIRDAGNAAAFLERSRARSGLRVRVLSTDEEARYGYVAAVNSTTLADGCVLDVGGGSLQLVRVTSRFAQESASWPMGAVRMTERFLPPGQEATRKRLDRLRDHVAAELAVAAWVPRSGDRLVAIGGTVRNLAAAAQAELGLVGVGIQGQCVTTEALDALIEALAALPAADRAKVPCIKPARADIILAGAVVVRAVCDVGGFDAVEVTEAGLREGVFFERLLRDATADGDPPLFEDVRRASVLNLAGRYAVEPHHTEHVVRLALGLFDALAEAGLHEGDPIERELLWAAAVLHDIGMSVDYDDHHKHSRYLVLNGGLPGFSPREVALIAQATRYHRKGSPDAGELAPLFERGDQARLERLSVLLRLAEDLERSRDQRVRAARVEADADDVTLVLDTAEEAEVQRWAARRETGLFRRAFGRELVVA